MLSLRRWRLDAPSHRVALRVDRFREMAPDARVLEVHLANHYVFMSNEAEVLAAIRNFIAGLP